MRHTPHPCVLTFKWNFQVMTLSFKCLNKCIIVRGIIHNECNSLYEKVSWVRIIKRQHLLDGAIRTCQPFSKRRQPFSHLNVRQEVLGSQLGTPATFIKNYRLLLLFSSSLSSMRVISFPTATEVQGCWELCRLHNNIGFGSSGFPLASFILSIRPNSNFSWIRLVNCNGLSSTNRAVRIRGCSQMRSPGRIIIPTYNDYPFYFCLRKRQDAHNHRVQKIFRNVLRWRLIFSARALADSFTGQILIQP
jgi:hypothetical protein